ncbi:MAG TPA: glycosyltransferase, partial [Chitinophagaceae bacterium]|nr:glycosyltransferase [Chitinophagaceae bacterium]
IRLANAEVVIIPSNNDNLPYAVLESMALGKIVLASKQGGQAEVIEDGQDGFIFDHDEPLSFSQQLTRILGMKVAEKVEVEKRAIQKVAQHLNYDSIYKRKIAIIEKITAQGKKDRKTFPFVQRQTESIPDPVDHGEIKGRLSVVIPYFNMGRYIHETINSILKSQHHDKEIIIINDGSTDDKSLEALMKYRDIPGVKVIDSPNRGLAHARNLGARESRAEYLAFLDADDTVKPDYYTWAIKNLSYYVNVHFVGCWSQYFGESDKKWPAFIPEPPLILYHNLVNSSALVYKRRSFLAAGKNDGDMVFPGFEDYESVISLTARGLKGIVLPELLFNYRVRQDSMIRSVSKEKKLFLYQYISNKHKDVYTAFATELFNLLNANGPGIALNNPTLDLHLADKIPFGSKASLQIIRLIKKNRHIRTIAYKVYSYTKK